MSCPAELALLLRLNELARLAGFTGLSMDDVLSLPRDLVGRLIEANNARHDFLRYVRERAERSGG